MPPIDRIEAFADDLTAIRRDFHAHPEIGFEEVRTSGIVADLLEQWGIETHRGLGNTGVVGVLKGARPGKRIGLRADMDALPIEEETNLPYRSTNPGVMHACGHDGHTTMLLGAARYLAETRDFAGEAVFIFQPAEEGLGGARAMIADGLFEKFPVDEVYGLHNRPNAETNQIGYRSGVAMAGADFFDITVRGRGAHGARPEESRDPLVAAAAMVSALQTIVSRSISPRHAAVVSVTQIHSGAAYNVIPGEAKLAGTARMFDPEVRDLIAARIRSIAEGVATAHGCEVDVDIRNTFDVLENDDALTQEFADMAREMMGDEQVVEWPDPATGSEDFADMLRVVPGTYFTVGHTGPAGLHNPGFVMDDTILPTGASLLARIVERRGAA